MLKIIKDFLSLNNISFTIILLPYIFFNFNYFVDSIYFSIDNFLIVIFFSLFLEIISKFIFAYKINKYLVSLITTFFLAFFYGYYFILLIQTQLSLFFNVADRGLIQLLFFLIILFIFFYFSRIKSFRGVNIFFIVFTLVTFVNTIRSFNGFSDFDSKSNLNLVSVDCEFSKPLLLIILDEYSSPDDLYKTTHDSSVYEFSNFLKSNNWIVNNKFPTNEISTIHSLSSMFNFNLSDDKKFKKLSVENLAHNKLMDSNLNDFFTINNIEVINFGIFDFGATEPFTRLYYYPKSFYELFFSNSLFHVLRIPFLNILNYDRELSNYPMEEHNKYLFNNLPDSLSKIKDNNFFVYSHFYMPHNPIIYRPEIDLLPNNFNNYLFFWKFTNSKIIDLILKLTEEDKYKIIITGDHGFKGDNKINPSFTFAAVYGFEEGVFNSIDSVQDLSILFILCQ